MSHVQVRQHGPREYAVQVSEDSPHGNAPSALSTNHLIRIDDKVLDDLGMVNPDSDDEQALVRESVEFLLEREQASSIGDTFELSDITVKYEEYLTEVATRLS
jgi:hypothetical protein